MVQFNDLQRLLAQFLGETHHCLTPFQLASQVPQNVSKTVIDALDRYHAIPLHTDSQPLAIFFREWGHLHYLQMS